MPAKSERFKREIQSVDNTTVKRAHALSVSKRTSKKEITNAQQKEKEYISNCVAILAFFRINFKFSKQHPLETM